MVKLYRNLFDSILLIVEVKVNHRYNPTFIAIDRKEKLLSGTAEVVPEKLF